MNPACSECSHFVAAWWWVHYPDKEIAKNKNLPSVVWIPALTFPHTVTCESFDLQSTQVREPRDIFLSLKKCIYTNIPACSLYGKNFIVPLVIWSYQALGPMKFILNFIRGILKMCKFMQPVTACPWWKTPSSLPYPDKDAVTKIYSLLPCEFSPHKIHFSWFLKSVIKFIIIPENCCK